MTRSSSILFLLLVLFLSSTSFAQENVFIKPSLRLDWCLHWGRDCGKPAADAFCQMYGYADAESWKTEGGLTTFVLGDGKICKGGCDGFSSINCRKTAPSTTKGTVPQYLGCFKDQGDPSGTSGRDLSGEFWQDGKMTIERCLDHCGQKNFPYAGVQYSTVCFCGNSYGKYGQAKNCDMKCGGNPSEFCGDVWANSIYSTGVKGGGGGAGPGGDSGSSGVGGGGGICADPRTLPIMDEWLSRAIPPQPPGSSLRYEPWGRPVGLTADPTGRIVTEIKTPGYPPDTRETRCEYLWHINPTSTNGLGTLREYVNQRLR